MWLKHGTRNFFIGYQSTTPDFNENLKSSISNSITVQSLGSFSFEDEPSFKENDATSLNNDFLDWIVTEKPQFTTLHIVFMSFFNDVVPSGEAGQSTKESQVLKALQVANPIT